MALLRSINKAVRQRRRSRNDLKVLVNGPVLRILSGLADAEGTPLLLRRAATEGPNSNPVLCGGFERRCSFGIMSFWISPGKSVRIRRSVSRQVAVERATRSIGPDGHAAPARGPSPTSRQGGSRNPAPFPGTYSSSGAPRRSISELPCWRQLPIIWSRVHWVFQHLANTAPDDVTVVTEFLRQRDQHSGVPARNVRDAFHSINPVFA